LADAEAHGAGDSPEFERKNAELAKTADQLRDALRANGGSTKEFDNRLREDTRAILRNKGLSQAQVDAHLAAHAERPIEGIVSISPPSAPSSAPRQPPKAMTPQTDDIADIAAALKAAGVVSASPTDTSKVNYKTAHADRNFAKDGRC
jgi:cell division septation protein DedD